MTEDLLQWLSEHLVRFGPIVLFVACLLETAIFAGLVVPVGALLAFAALLSARGFFDPALVVAAALAGAALGDQLGFAVGRWFMPTAKPPKGKIATLWSRALGAAQALVRSRGGAGIILARPIPFVRTIMPWFAGRSGMPWWRFLVFDLLGVLAWGVVYIGGGFVIGVGWREASVHFGEVAGVLVLALVLLIIIVLARVWSAGAFGERPTRGGPPI